MKNSIPQGNNLEPSLIFQSYTKSKFTNQAEAKRLERPSDLFEPGYDKIGFISPRNKNAGSPRNIGLGLQLSYNEAKAIAYRRN